MSKMNQRLAMQVMKFVVVLLPWILILLVWLAYQDFRSALLSVEGMLLLLYSPLVALAFLMIKSGDR